MKKLLLSIGSVAVLSTPVALAISCGGSGNHIDTSFKFEGTDVTEKWLADGVNKRSLTDSKEFLAIIWAAGYNYGYNPGCITGVKYDGDDILVKLEWNNPQVGMGSAKRWRENVQRLDNAIRTHNQSEYVQIALDDKAEHDNAVNIQKGPDGQIRTADDVVNPDNDYESFPTVLRYDKNTGALKNVNLGEVAVFGQSEIDSAWEMYVQKERDSKPADSTHWDDETQAEINYFDYLEKERLADRKDIVDTYNEVETA